jgi:acyl-CoA dehydrogenase
MGNFQWERLSLALGAVGAMEEMLEGVMAHVRERRAFGHALHEFQVVRHKLADLATELKAAHDIQRHWRDARLGPIDGGTSEIMNEIIARQLGL